MNTKSEDDRESMRKLLPILAGKVQAVVAAKGRWTDKDLSSRTIQARTPTTPLHCSSAQRKRRVHVHVHVLHRRESYCDAFRASASGAACERRSTTAVRVRRAVWADLLHLQGRGGLLRGAPMRADAGVAVSTFACFAVRWRFPEFVAA